MEKRGVFVKLRKAKNIQEKYKLLDQIIIEYINPEILSFSKYAEKNIVNNLIKRTFTEKEFKQIKNNMLFVLNEKVDKINYDINMMMKDYLWNPDVNDKGAKSLTNYVKNTMANDISLTMNSILLQTDKALSVINLAVNNIKKSDVNLLYSEIQRAGNITQNYKAFSDVLKSDYSQRYMQEIMKNPTISKLIEQKGEIYTININGRNYDLEKYLENKAKQQSIDVIRQTENIRAIENNSQVFEFVRIYPAKEPREHSKYENMYFSNNTEIVGTDYNGKEVKDDRLINDFRIGDLPPYGCGHIYIAV